ncbi:MAG: hypothetical protein M0Z36_07560 [Thermaerobacter sp.]|nr:hypothetical protein [Thermaerobacter sp.]
MSNPACNFIIMKLDQRMPKALTMDEWGWWRVVCRTTLQHAVVEFCFATSCRMGKPGRLVRRDLDGRRNGIVAGKGNKVREVYLGSNAWIWLVRCVTERQDGDPVLWVRERAPPRPWFVIRWRD